MMTKTEATIKSVKDLSGELSAWEGRLMGIRAEVESLTKNREVIKKEIEDIRSTLQQEAEKVVLKNRQATQALEDARQKFDSDKAEFEKVLISFKQERNAFEREKTDALDMKKNYTAMTEKVSRFVLFVKREAETL